MPETTPTTLSPEAQAALDTFRRTYPDFPSNVDAMASYIKKHPSAAKDWATLQIIAKPPKDYRIDPASGGLVHNSSLKKFLAMSALLVGSVATAGLLAPALAGGGGAAAAGGTAAATGGGAAAGGTAAAGAGASIWGSIARNAIPVAGGIASTVIQSKANSAATKAEQEAADRALKQQKDMYDQDVARERERIARDEGRYNTNQSQLQPYYDTGLSSLNQLNRGLGQPQVAAPPPAHATAPQGAPPSPTGAGATPGSLPPQGGSLNALGPSQGLAVAMIAPDGRPLQVPRDRVEYVTSIGGRMA